MGRQYDNRGRDQINFENVQGNVILPEDRRVERSRSELILLKAVSDEVTSRLSQSLHNAVLINLDKQVQPQQVKRPWDAEIKIGALPSQPLPPETKILDVFERSDIQGKVLILGDPGSGKTTTLLDLAQGLVERAIADPTAPIPVIFTLSSWKDPKQLMKDWLIAELKSKYGVRIDIGKKWIEDKQLLPLLDGLDEVKPEHQESCVNAINRLLASDDRPSDLGVCSRREEYENYQVRLHLNGAIRLQALTDGQIQQYFHTLKQPQLWQTMQLDAALLELIRTPLFLGIVGLSVTEQKFSFSDWRSLTSREARLQYLFDVFWEAAIDRVLVEPRLSAEGIQSKTYWKNKPPTAKQTRRWLIFLAQQLQKESETEFLIEKMQPNWLISRNQPASSRMVKHFSIMVMLIFYLTLSLPFGISSGIFYSLLIDTNTGLFIGSTYILNIGVAILIPLLCQRWMRCQQRLNVDAALNSIGTTIEIEPINLSLPTTLQLPLTKQARISFIKLLMKGLAIGSTVGLIATLEACLIIGLLQLLVSIHFPKHFLASASIFSLEGISIGLFSGAAIGLSVGIIHGLRSEIKITKSPNEGTFLTLKTSVVMASMLACLAGFLVNAANSEATKLYQFRVSSGLLEKLSIFFHLPPLVLSISFLISGGLACTVHFSLRLVLYHNDFIASPGNPIPLWVGRDRCAGQGVQCPADSQ